MHTYTCLAYNSINNVSGPMVTLLFPHYKDRTYAKVGQGLMSVIARLHQPNPARQDRSGISPFPTHPQGFEPLTWTKLVDFLLDSSEYFTTLYAQHHQHAAREWYLQILDNRIRVLVRLRLAAEITCDCLEWLLVTLPLDTVLEM